MPIKKPNLRVVILLFFMIMVGIVRVLNSIEFNAWSNFTPIGAMAIFGGAYFTPRWKAFAFPLFTLFIGDLIIYALLSGNGFGGRPLIYVAFALIVLIGVVIIKRVTVKQVALASVTSTLSFWLMADFYVWLGGGIDIRTQLPLSRDLAGLIQCYWQGLPYMINFLLGTLFYSGIMFGGIEWIKKQYPALLAAPITKQSQP